MRGRREGETGNRDFSVPGMGFVLFWLTVFFFFLFLLFWFCFSLLTLLYFLSWGGGAGGMEGDMEGLRGKQNWGA